MDTSRTSTAPSFVMLWCIALLLMVIVSSVALVYVKHQNRESFIKLQSMLKERDKMQVVWGQLLLEQSTLTTQGRIEQIAQTQLNMKVPEPRSVVRVAL